MQWPRPGLAQPLSRSRSVPRLYNYARGWDSTWVSCVYASAWADFNSSERMRWIEANTCSRDNVIFTFNLRHNAGAVDLVPASTLDLSNYTNISRLPVHQASLYAWFLHGISTWPLMMYYCIIPCSKKFFDYLLKVGPLTSEFLIKVFRKQQIKELKQYFIK